MAEKTADTGFRLGSKARLHLALDATSTYDTNSLFSDVNPVSDFVTVLSPGADLRWQTHKLEVSSGYRFSLRDNVEQNTQDNRAHSGFLSGSYKLSRRLSTEVEETYVKGSDPADIEIPERLQYVTNEAAAALVYETPGKDFDLRVRYMNTYREYSADQDALSFFNNKVSITSRVNVSSHFRFLPKSILFCSAEYGRNDFRDDPAFASVGRDSDGLSLSTGLRSQFSRRFAAEAKVGSTMLWFEAGPDSYAVSGGASINYKTGPFFTVSLGYNRADQLSTFTNFYAEHRVNLDWTWKLARKISLNSENYVAWMDFSGPSVTATNETRSDFVTRSMVRLKYDFRKWLGFSLMYEFDRRTSNARAPLFGTASADFVKHRGSAIVSFYY